MKGPSMLAPSTSAPPASQGFLICSRTRSKAAWISSMLAVIVVGRKEVTPMEGSFWHMVFVASGFLSIVSAPKQP